MRFMIGKGAAALVYPSLIERFGLPVLAATRCATPVLTSNTSPLSEVGGDEVLAGHSFGEVLRMGTIIETVKGCWMLRGRTLLRRTYSVVAVPALKSGLTVLAGAMALLVPGNAAYDAFSKHGYHLLRKHFYLPIPDQADLACTQPSDLVGLEMNDDVALGVLRDIVSHYNDEFNRFPVHATSHLEKYYLINGTFMAVDGNVYYAFIRHFKPRRVIEVGSGNSTLLAAAAIRANRDDGLERDTELICIEPYPSSILRQPIPELTHLIEDRVQHVDLALFQSMEPGDILFIDSTHALRPGGDVWWEYCEILPRLAPGVLVHIHDVSLPKPYPRVYADNHWYWTEQYLLQAFLAFNTRFEVIWPGNYLMVKYPDTMACAFQPAYGLMRESFPSSEPSSFWLRVRQGSGSC